MNVRAELLTFTATNGWTYTTVIADVAEPVSTVANEESVELRWVAVEEVANLPLHPAFEASWPRLHAELVSLRSR